MACMWLEGGLAVALARFCLLHFSFPRNLAILQLLRSKAVADLSAGRQLLYMDFIRALAANPHSMGDFAETDEVGRTVYVKILGRFAITFWADHPGVGSQGHSHPTRRQIARRAR